MADTNDLDKAQRFLKMAGRVVDIGIKGIDITKKMKANHEAGCCVNPACPHPDIEVEAGAPLGLCEECFIRAAARIAKVGRHVGTR